MACLCIAADVSVIEHNDGAVKLTHTLSKASMKRKYKPYSVVCVKTVHAYHLLVCHLLLLYCQCDTKAGLLT